MTGEDGRDEGAGSREPERPREVRPNVRGLFGAAMAAVTSLLLVGTAADLGLEKPGRLLAAVVLVGCVSGVVWGVLAQRQWAVSRLSPQANMALTFAVLGLLWGTYRAASRVWTQLEAILWVFAGGAVYGVAAAVCALVLRGLGPPREHQPRAGG